MPRENLQVGGPLSVVAQWVEDSDNKVSSLSLTEKGNVGIKTEKPFQPLTVGHRDTGDGQTVMLRVVGETPQSWKGGAAFGNALASVIIGELGGIATIGGHNADLSGWSDLFINSRDGNVGIGIETTPTAKLEVGGGIKATALEITGTGPVIFKGIKGKPETMKDTRVVLIDPSTGRSIIWTDVSSETVPTSKLSIGTVSGYVY